MPAKYVCLACLSTPLSWAPPAHPALPCVPAAELTRCVVARFSVRPMMLWSSPATFPQGYLFRKQKRLFGWMHKTSRCMGKLAAVTQAEWWAVSVPVLGLLLTGLSSLYYHLFNVSLPLFLISPLSFCFLFSFTSFYYCSTVFSPFSPENITVSLFSSTCIHTHTGNSHIFKCYIW